MQSGDELLAGGGPRTAAGYLAYLVRKQPWRTVAAAILSTVWMVLLAVPPYLLQQAIDNGLRAHDMDAVYAWAGALLAVGAITAAIGINRHRVMTRIRNRGMLHTVEIVVAHSTRLGATLPRRVTTGEVAAIGISDVTTIGQSLTVVGPGFGGLIAYLVIAAYLVHISVLLAAVVLAGVPVLAGAVGPALRRMQSAGHVYRERQGILTGRLVDIVNGLRVLNGLGGKEVYQERYHRQSAALQAEGYRVGAAASWVMSLATGLPTLFLAVVTWLAARMAATGEITIGNLAAVYGYVAILALPVGFMIECGYTIGRALVCAKRVVRFLHLRPDHAGAEPTAAAPAVPSALHDPDSGVTVADGRLTAIVSARPAEAAQVVERLGRFTDQSAPTGATWGGTRLIDMPIGPIRDRILLADNDAHLFRGSLRSIIAGAHPRPDPAVDAAIDAAVARDIVDGLPDGLDTEIDADGRNVSGGQRQRIRLARALHAEPEVLLAVEPTSAVDAHTEAAMAGGLRAARTGRTTVVTTTSPLVLDRADIVYFLRDGRAVASGTHQELLGSAPAYRALVSREEG